MEPLKIIYDGYEIEIRSGGCDSMPIVSMKKMVSNKPEVDEDFYKKMMEEALKGYQQQRGWWENPLMWLYPFYKDEKHWAETYTTNTTAEWTNKDSLHPDSNTTTETKAEEKIVNNVPSVWEEKNNTPLKYESYTNTKPQDEFLYVDGKRYKANKDGIINDNFYSDWE